MAKKNLRILVDLDGIVADFFGLLFREYEWETGESIDISQILSWDMAQYVQHPETLNRIFFRPGFFTRLKPIPGALESLRALAGEGHELVIVSSPCTPHSAAEKVDWCKTHLPFLDQKNVWIGHKKHHVRGDVLIDDGPHNAVAYRSEHPEALLVSIAYPYNEGAPYNLRVHGHEDPAGAWRAILNHIRSHALVD
jgi:5'-nucleotidase